MRPRKLGHVLVIGTAAGVLGCAFFLFIGAEGFVCAAMAIPIVVPLAMLGSLLVHLARLLARPKSPTAMLLLVPLTLFFDTHTAPPVYAVTTTTVIDAPPERVWKYVVAFPDIPSAPDWLLRTGLAYPIRTRIEGSGVGARRSCDLSTGTVAERVTAWDESHLLRFAVTATPPAMREHGLYGPIYPRHLHGYYISKAGEFSLTALPGNRTLVAGTSWYQHGLYPAAYWRLWTDMVIHHIHRRVFAHIRALAEAKER